MNERVTVDELLGIAVGCIGMSLQDFDQCTPLEFNEIYECWSKERQMQIRNDWERTRQLTVRLLLPYSQKALKAEDVMEFVWDKKNDGDAVANKEKTREEIEAEARHFERVKKARGLL